MSVQVYIENTQSEVSVTPEMYRLIEQVIATAAEMENLSSGEVSVLLVDDRDMRDYNAQYRGVDRPTDVLSFSMLEGEDGIDEERLSDANSISDSNSLPEEEAPLLLGDILISLPRTVAQAVEYGHSFERELGFLVAHGFLHLLGYDHDTPEAEEEMFSRQENVLARLGLSR